MYGANIPNNLEQCSLQNLQNILTIGQILANSSTIEQKSMCYI